jgi:hypothetical protein
MCVCVCVCHSTLSRLESKPFRDLLIIQLQNNAPSSVLFLSGCLCVVLVDIYANELCSEISTAGSDAK